MTDPTVRPSPGGGGGGGGRSNPKIVPVRHPGRWVASAAILVLAAMLINTLFFSHVTRGGVREGRYQWGVVGKYLFAAPIFRGIVVTLELTVLAMVVGIEIGRAHV